MVTTQRNGRDLPASPRYQMKEPRVKPWVLSFGGGERHIARVHDFAVSLDGFGTGENQLFEEPCVHAGGRPLESFLGTRSFQAIYGDSCG